MKVVSWEHPKIQHFPLPCVVAQAHVQPFFSPTHSSMHVPHTAAQLAELMQRDMANTLV